MKNTVLFMLLFAASTQILVCQDIPDSDRYLGQTPPGNVPEIFAPGILSLVGRSEYCISISPSGKEITFALGGWPTRKTMIVEYVNGAWTSPDTISFSETRSVDEAIFSPDGQRIYCYAYNSPNSMGGADLCYSQRTETGWSELVNLGSPLNTSQDEYHPCVVADGSIYFENSPGRLCYSKFENGNYLPRVSLPTLFNDGTMAYGNPYLDPNESYFLFNSARSGGFGATDFYISYKKENGSWTNPKNLGSQINTNGSELACDVTPDGQYMTFTRSGDFYWVSTSFIDSLRHTNYAPYLATAIPNQVDTVGRLFSYTISDTSFIDDDGNNTLTYAATLSTGAPLPGWLTFNPETRTLSGTAENSGTTRVKITVTDTANCSASASFNVKIANPVSSIDTDNFGDLNVFPNPAHDQLFISLGIIPTEAVVVDLVDLQGKVLLTNLCNNQSLLEMNVSDIQEGIYVLRLQCSKGVLCKRIVIN